jgi:hypothetical protein
LHLVFYCRGTRAGFIGDSGQLEVSRPADASRRAHCI